MRDRPSLELLYTTWAPEVRRFAYWLTRDTTTAEDITSETFVRMWTHLDVVRTESMKGYLMAIARNLALTELRRRRRHGPLDAEHRDSGRDPATDAEVASGLRSVLDAVNNLPQGEREALVLRAVEGLPYEEIARVLGISVVAVKVRVHRARARLIARTADTKGE